jgi:signal transduction histidine kinase
MYIFLNLHRRFVIPGVTVVLTLLAYITLFYFAQSHVPLVRLSSTAQDLFFISNISGTIILVALFSLIYSRAAYANNRALERARQISDENMQRAQELLSIVSHDIANSVFICSGSLQMLNKKKLLDSEVAQTWAQRMALGIRNIEDIIDSVRMLRSIEDGKRQVALQPVEVGAILEKTRQTFLERLAEKNVALELCCPQDGTLRVLAEPLTLYNNVFCNLVSNALKFSFPNSSIQIAAVREERFVKITVADSGIGIPPEMLGKLFNFGEKTSRPGTSGEMGTGYGMPVVKRFIDLYKGQIAVSSVLHREGEAGHGTTFELRLLPA